MTIDLLLDEEQYQDAVEQVLWFAEQNGVKILDGSSGIVQMATTMLMALELEPEAFVMLTKLIYNVGYRDNTFSGLSVH